MAAVRLSTKAVGNIVRMKVNNMLTDFIVVHQGKPSSMYDDSCDGTWLLMKDIYENRQCRNSDVNDYANSTIHSYLNNTFISLFDSNIRNAIKQIKIPYRPGSGTSTTVSSGSSGLLTKIFLLAVYEVGWKNLGESAGNKYYPADGVKVSYFDAGTETAANNKRVAYIGDLSSTWWLRSPYAYSERSMLCVNAYGQDVASNCSESHGVRPALVLPSMLLVHENGEVYVNLPPAISGSNASLGTFSASPPMYNYTVTDPNNDVVTVVETLNGAMLRTYTATLGATNTLTFTADSWRKMSNGNHTITITATDPHGLFDTRTLTFVKAVKEVQFTTDPLPADAMPTKAIVNIQGYFPAGSTLAVEICNNGNDANPAWEDITVKVLSNQKHFFANASKTAAKWAVRLRVKLSRGTAAETCYIQSIGGNFA